jgi:TldD protein
MRADGWNRIPLIRMTNVSLEPGTWELEDMIRGHRRTASTWRPIVSWSIDDMRLNFQFGTQLGYEIKNGKRRGCCETARTPASPRSSGIPAMRLVTRNIGNWGTPNCGKGEPMQVMGTGHGAAPARLPQHPRRSLSMTFKEIADPFSRRHLQSRPRSSTAGGMRA